MSFGAQRGFVIPVRICSNSMPTFSTSESWFARKTWSNAMGQNTCVTRELKFSEGRRTNPWERQHRWLH
jgi:hypothetical protein